jgi:hypothetical protein
MVLSLISWFESTGGCAVLALDLFCYPQDWAKLASRTHMRVLALHTYFMAVATTAQVVGHVLAFHSVHMQHSLHMGPCWGWRLGWCARKAVGV